MNIGNHIRQTVIPAGMSVTEAAKRLGVGRPALSNLLNGKASLSREMALRLERSFGADRQALLNLQADADRDRSREGERSVAVGAYVPTFLQIKARQIHDWADRIEARQQLPVLLRRLIHSTGRDLRHVDFPGYDNAERRDWDGRVEADVATPWIPEGESGWEFGTNQQPAAKADHDYSNRLCNLSTVERADLTFVFVTPRNWPGKNDWARSKAEIGDWKGVRAFDASDLEQWLEESIAAQIWLAERLGIPTDGFETLDQSWDQWAAASEPRMTAKTFEHSISVHRAKIQEWLKLPPDRPFVVAADSKDEALAFLACLFEDCSIPRRYEDQAAVFKSAQTLRTLARSSSPFIPIVYTQDAEREIASVYRRRHCIVIRPRNAVDRDPDIALELLGHETFKAALADMGIEHDESDRLARESGHSPTILRRRLSKIEAIKTPCWAADLDIARSLTPIVLVGAWHKESKADCEILSILATGEYPDVEETIARLLELDDCPVWSVSQYRGVVSKIDALFAVSRSFTAESIEEFLELAEYVLSESDPALDLPEDKRYMAGIYDKVREHSKALRDGMCETLVLLAVHGNGLFQNRLGIDIEMDVSSLIGRLLTPLTLDKLLSHEHDLRSYAEAAPDEVLKLIETDLQRPEPVIQGLLKPAGTGVFDGPTRTGLLWALESLAWNPSNLARVSCILAQLSQTKIDDNWGNQPIASLAATFRSWCPQTAALLDDRIKGLEMLADKFPDIGWQICIQQIEPGPQLGLPSYRPRWRADGAGAGEVVTERERCQFKRKALDLILTWPEHDDAKLGDLIDRLQAVPDEDQSVVWNLVERWSETETDDEGKARLRDRIRSFALTRLGRLRHLNATAIAMARAAYEKLAPGDLVIRHKWLFASEWVEAPVDDAADDDEGVIDELRTEAMHEIWEQRGFDGVVALLAESSATYSVGRHALLSAVGRRGAAGLLQASLSVNVDPDWKLDAFMHGIIEAVAPTEHRALLADILTSATVDQKLRLLRSAPFGDQTWFLLDRQPQHVRDGYWREVRPDRIGLSGTELNEVVNRLLAVNRPRAAFQAVCWDWDKIETSRLKRLLVAIATTNDEPGQSPELDPYHVSSALDSLDGRADVTSDEMAKLELAFIEAVDNRNHGIPNLERQVAEYPDLFVQVLALLFRRTDEGQDPPDWQVENPDQRAAAAQAAFRLLERISLIPGTDSQGKVQAESLRRWVVEVRRVCAAHGRAKVGDHWIGQLLSKAPAEDSSLWPCRPVCEVIETVRSQDIAQGFSIGVYNARGVHWRGEGGDQERELAAKYRGWARQVDFDYPYVSSVLERIAASYDKEGEREDSEAIVRRRLNG